MPADKTNTSHPGVGEFVATVAMIREEEFQRRKELAERLGPAFNEALRQMPHETPDGKRAIGKWVNAQLKPLGLAVRCPRTGKPGNLYGRATSETKYGQFVIGTKDENGREKQRFTTGRLPETGFELMPRESSHLVDLSEVARIHRVIKEKSLR